MAKYNYEDKSFWDSIQKYYDEGNSVEDSCKNFKISQYTFDKATKKGLLKKRSLSKSMKISHKLLKHPGWKSVNIDKNRRSYPERYFLNRLKNHNLFKKYTFIEKFPFEKYVFDFVLVEFKIDIEIDGSFHYNDKYTIEKDRVRDELAIEKGWKVFRILWDDLQANPQQEFERLENFIKSKNMTDSYDIDVIIKRKNPKCSKCKKIITRDSKSGLCKKCSNIEKGLLNRKIKRPTKEELEKMINTMSWVAIGREYGVSDNAIRKWAKNYNIL